MNSAVYGPLYGTDNRAAIWHFWWFNYAHRNNLEVDTNILTNYPSGIKNLSPKIFPLAVIPAYLLSITFNEIFAYNFLILLSFILSFLFMYVLVFYLTKNKTAAFVSGLIYSLCPYHINKSWEHFGLTFIEFIPLCFYFLLKLRERPNLKNIVLCSLGLVLVAFSDISYCFIIGIFSFLYVVFLLFYVFKKRHSAKEFFSNLLPFIASGFLSLLLILPLIVIPYVQGAVLQSSDNLESSGLTQLERPFHYLFSQSATMFSYLVPSWHNPLLGGLARSLEGSVFFGRNFREQTLYLGWVSIFLLCYFFKKRNKTSEIVHSNQKDFAQSLFIFIFFASIIFSMPPYWNLLFFKIYFPSSFIYKIFPIFRAYARFGVLAMVSISVLAGFGFKYLFYNNKKRRILMAFFTVLILVDFATIPPLRVSSVNQCHPVYSWLAENDDTFAIAEYPITLGDRTEGYVNLDYLLNQRFHEKALINGASPGTPSYSLKQRIVKLTDPETPGILRSLGAKYVIVHLDEYRQGHIKEAVDIIGEIPDFSKAEGLQLEKKIGDAEIYQVIAKPIEIKELQSFK